MAGFGRVSDLSGANENLRAQLLEKQRAVSALHMSIASVESRQQSSALGRDVVDTPGALVAAADHGHDAVSELVHHVTHQLMTDSDELDVLAQAIDQVDIMYSSLFTISGRHQKITE